jgi:hypothetical protein
LNGNGTEEQQPDKETDKKTKNPNKTSKNKKNRGKGRKEKAKPFPSSPKRLHEAGEKASLRRPEKKPRVFPELLSLKQNVSHDLNAI